MFCTQCGKEFTGRKRKYCSKKCRLLAYGNDPEYKPEPNCLVCSKILIKGQKKYCSNICCHIAYERRKGTISIDEYKKQRKEKEKERYGRTCKQCGRFFVRRDGGSKTDGSGSFCSKKCWGAWRSGHKMEINGYYPGAKCKVYFKICEYCGKIYTSRIKSKRSFCCEYHRGIKDYYDNRETILKKGRDKYKAGWISPVPFVCKWCGRLHKPEYGDTSSVYCSRECLNRAKRDGRKLKKRAESIGVYYEYVNPIKVFDRDEWRCQLCGKKLRKKDRGTYKDSAPELDHIITWAEGGEHSYRNTQCACRRCNQKKGSQSLGQLRVFG